MLISQSDIFDVPQTKDTILEIREGSTTGRILSFKNLRDQVLRVEIHKSDDGGTTWTVMEQPIVLGPAGSELEEQMKDIDAEGFLKIQASGGRGNGDMAIVFVRTCPNQPAVWSGPRI